MSSTPEKTERNLEICKLIQEGISHKDIATQYGISYQRVGQIFNTFERKKTRKPYGWSPFKNGYIPPKMQNKSKNESEPVRVIDSWWELAHCKSKTHILDIDVRHGCGWIYLKNADNDDKEWCEKIHYLSTHTFYEECIKISTDLLQACGFNVELVNNWTN